MSDLAHYHATRAPVADTPARRALRFLVQPAALGLLLALLAAALLGNWFHRQAATGLVAEKQSRIAILEGSALADFVAARLQAAAEAEAQAEAAVAAEGTGEAPVPVDPSAMLQAALTDWVERSPEDDAIRVVRLGGARLLASTFPAERSGELPRRLTKDEKWLFDLGQELRAAADTNRAEGVFRKPQIDVTRVGTGRIRITVPYLVDGAIEGFVQHERPLETLPATRAPLPLLLVVPSRSLFG